MLKTISEKTWDYVLRHAAADVRQLALKGTADADIDLSLALQLIAGRQTARRKLPTWAATERIVYPPHLNLEQCSSERTARYKASVAGSGRSMADLTGGFGVDFYFLSEHYGERTYVEHDAALADMVAHNCQLLGRKATFLSGTAAEVLPTLPRQDLIFMDPARRDDHGGRTYALQDCTPDVLQLLPTLWQHTDRLLLKLSPMLDWHKAVSDVNQSAARNAAGQPPRVTAVHVVSVDGECKELLLDVATAPLPAGGLRVVCVNLKGDGEERFEFTAGPAVAGPVGSGQAAAVQGADGTQQGAGIAQQGAGPTVPYVAEPDQLTGGYLYEPNASIMKAGCFRELTLRYGVSQVAENSHLFVADGEMGDFPGRRFQILAISSMNKQELKRKIGEILHNFTLSMKSANIAVRNFPLTADQLRRRLKLADGGPAYIFATTLADGQHRLFICRKIG